MSAITVATAPRGLTHSVRTDGRTGCGRPINFTAGWAGRVPSVTVDCTRCSHVPAPSATVAAASSRAEVTVAVPDVDDYREELPHLEAFRDAVAADAALGALRGDGGSFGAALAGLGFGDFVDGTSWDGVWYRTEHDSGAFRVICYPQDGERVVLIGWDAARPAAKLEAWRIAFDGGTPQSVVLAAIANAVGRFPISR